MSTLTAKQQAWDEHKAAVRTERAATRAVPTTPRARTITGACPDCPHTWKHHNYTGRCRPGCPCTNGQKRAKR